MHLSPVRMHILYGRKFLRIQFSWIGFDFHGLCRLYITIMGSSLSMKPTEISIIILCALIDRQLVSDSMFAIGTLNIDSVIAVLLTTFYHMHHCY